MTIKDVAINNGSKLPINEFKLDMMCKNPSIVMIAKRGSGKSYVCRSILYHFSDIPAGEIIAPTDRMNCFYGDFFYPQVTVFYFGKDCRQVVVQRELFLFDELHDGHGRKKLADRGRMKNGIGGYFFIASDHGQAISPAIQDGITACQSDGNSGDVVLIHLFNHDRINLPGKPFGSWGDRQVLNKRFHGTSS